MRRSEASDIFASTFLLGLAEDVSPSSFYPRRAELRSLLFSLHRIAMGFRLTGDIYHERFAGFEL
jgi:hypothetical protein